MWFRFGNQFQGQLRLSFLCIVAEIGCAPSLFVVIALPVVPICYTDRHSMHHVIRILRSPEYIGLALFVSWLTLSIALFVPNLVLLFFGLGIDGVGWWDHMLFAFGFYGSLFTNFTPFSGTITVLVSVLFGLNVTLLTYYVRMMRGNHQSVRNVEVLSLFGLVSGFFGIGCAVCGSVILTTLLGLFGSGGLLLALPYGGEEFSVLAVVILGFSLVLLEKRIERGRVC